MIKDNLVMLCIVAWLGLVAWIGLVAGISINELFYYKDSCKYRKIYQGEF